MNKLFVICVLVLLLPTSMASIELQSPEASSITQVGAGAEPGADGNVGFTTPVGVVKGRTGFDLPITLAYQAGIRLDQEASWVGLGFDLSFGAITRSPIGIPDDYTTNNGGKKGFLSIGEEEYGDQDYYYVSFPGGSSKLILYKNNEMGVVYPANWQKWDIQMYDAWGNTWSSSYFSGTIEYWTITTTDGTKYTFGKTPESRSYSKRPHSTTYPLSIGVSSPFDGSPDVNTDLSTPYVSAWYLTSIESPNYRDLPPYGYDDQDRGNWIVIDYEKTDFYRYVSPNPRTKHECEYSPSCQSICDQQQWPSCWSPLLSQLGDYTFNSMGRGQSHTMISFLYSKSETQVQMVYPSAVRTPLMRAEFVKEYTRFDGRDHSTPEKRLARLNEIQFFDADSDKLLSSTVFTYASPSEELAKGADGNGADGNDQRGRLTLKKVQTFGYSGEALPPVIFDYYRPELRYHKYAWDWWGYPNGFNDNPQLNLAHINSYCYYLSEQTSIPSHCDNYQWEHLYPYFEGRSSDVIYGYDDYYNPDHSTTQDVSAWSVKTVHYGTGGSIEYVYEPGSYTFVPKGSYYTQLEAPVPAGIRLKEKKISDGLQTESYVTRYQYGPGVTTLELNWQSRYTNDWSSIGPHNGNTIVYEWIRKIMPDEKGSTVTEYRTFKDGPVATTTCVRNRNIGSSSNVKISTFSQDLYLTHNPHLVYPVRTKVYSGSELVDVVKESWSNIPVPVTKASYYENEYRGKGDAYVDRIDCNADYTLFSKWQYVQSDFVTQDGNTVSKHYSYHHTNGLPVSITSYNSDGSRRIEHITYAAYDSQTDPVVASTMLYRNMVSQQRMSSVMKPVDDDNFPQDGLLEIPETLANGVVEYRYFSDTNNDGVFEVHEGSCVGCPVYPYATISWVEDTNNNNEPDESDVYSRELTTRYDKYGQMLQAVNPKGYAMNAYYGDDGACNQGDGTNKKLTCVEDPVGNKLKGYYDEYQRLTSMESAYGLFTHYYYDGLNRLYAQALPSRVRNLLKNPGMELGNAGHGVPIDGNYNSNDIQAWFMSWGSPVAYRHSLFDGDARFVRTGKMSLALAESGNVHQWVSLQGGQTYWVSGWVYTPSISTCIPYMDLWLGADGRVSGTLQGEWEFLKKSFYVSSTDEYRFRLGMAGSGGCNVYFDDVVLSTQEPFEKDSFSLAYVHEYNYGYEGEDCQGFNDPVGNTNCLNWVQVISTIDEEQSTISRSVADGLGRDQQSVIIKSLDPPTAVFVVTTYNERGFVDQVSAPQSFTIDLKDNEYLKVFGNTFDYLLGKNYFSEVNEKFSKSDGEGEDSVKYVYYDDPLKRVYKVYPLSSYDPSTLTIPCGQYHNDVKVDCGMNEFSPQVPCPQGYTQGYTCTKYTDNEGYFVLSVIDKYGKVVSVINAEEELTEYEYDQMNRIKKLWDAERPAGNLKNQPPAKEYEYNVGGQLVRSSDVNTIGNKLYEYDLNGNILVIRDADGERVTEFVYDELDRIRKVLVDGVLTAENMYGDGSALLGIPDMNCVKDCPTCSSDGLLCKVREEIYDTEIGYVYDAQRQLAEVHETFGSKTYVTKYDHTLSGDLHKLTMDNDEWITYHYNMLNQLQYVNIKDVPPKPENDGHAFKFTYEDIGAVKDISYPHGFVQSFEYNPKKHLESITISDGATVHFNEVYEYDNTGNLLVITDALNNKQAQFTYDGASRLKTINNMGGYYNTDEFSLGSIEYFYDGVGNRLQRVVQAGDNDIVWSEIYDYAPGTDKLITTQQAGCTYEYDSFGNVVGKSCAEEGTTTFRYDKNDMISSITMPDGTVFKFQYDALGRRVVKTEQKGKVVTTTKYVYGAGGNPLIVDESSTGETPQEPQQPQIAPPESRGMRR